jgi:hypothetical protein
VRLTEVVKMQLNAGIKNLFNSYQRDFDSGINRDPAYIYGPTSPQMIYFGSSLVISGKNFQRIKQKGCQSETDSLYSFVTAKKDYYFCLFVHQFKTGKHGRAECSNYSKEKRQAE